jgi:aspartyl-tRNA(Asn)/glutamyl-tRNA(Gln) amidotransferase subunit C
MNGRSLTGRMMSSIGRRMSLIIWPGIPSRGIIQSANIGAAGEFANRLSIHNYSIVIIIPMSLTLAEVEHIAELARLELTEDEKARYREQLSDILDYAARLQAVDTSQIPPMASVLAKRSLLRADLVLEGLKLDQALKNAPASAEDQFRVPPVQE